jgi:dinuclear metal center YbgI/SA1388 family protein
MKAKDIIRFMENNVAPLRLAVKGDPIGLQAGNVSRYAKRIMLSLDVNMQILTEAMEKEADMIISHHPAFYGGLDIIDEESRKGELAALISRSLMVVYAAHTNLDAAEGGVADCLADICGLPKEGRKVLEPTYREPFLKLTAFVPTAYLKRVQKAICAAGAGKYEKYSDCTFRLEGTGTFKGNNAATPFIGKAGKYEEAAEYRLETRVRLADKHKVEKALLKAHPYETPAYDFTRLEENIIYGLGRVAELPKAVSIKNLAQDIKTRLKAPGMQLCGRLSAKVKRIAVWSGSGLPIKEAAQNGADLIITGECNYHSADDSDFFNIPIIKLGHGVSEKIVLPALSKRLKKEFPNLTIMTSKAKCAPFINF